MKRHFEGCRSVINIGCGQGQLLNALGKNGARRLVGIENSAAGVTASRRNLFESGLTGPIVKGTFPYLDIKERFDLVTSAFVLQHVREKASHDAEDKEKSLFVEGAIQLTRKRLILALITSLWSDGRQVELPFERSLDVFIRERGLEVTMFDIERRSVTHYGRHAGKFIKYGRIVAERNDLRAEMRR
ncbi:MAG: methyltransferase domain-containing protein [Candidatus Micrarchaeota archaeon]|nr:methyltransferase domain-containing protein [Candidatus Micrarchaeota archaeon]MDE1834744.1 methyltransferase domain-containing protein [Candidatus Micrarchaeota archaeon]MDE1859370.1 methyltransferase domain-containing protein [Candidatus Micrarchaeota archaeon]